MKFVTAREYAESKNLPLALISKLCRQGDLPCIKRKSWYINIDTADEALGDVISAAQAAKKPATKTNPKKAKKEKQEKPAVRLRRKMKFVEGLKALKDKALVEAKAKSKPFLSQRRGEIECEDSEKIYI